MTEQDIPHLIEHFADLPDPRAARGIRHNLTDIVTISILAVICGANTYTQIQQYALANESWLRSFLDLPFGIPSVDTFERLFAILKPDAWQDRFLTWARTLALPDLAEGEDEILAMDGKTARRSTGSENTALHTVSVWSSQAGIVLSQQQVPTKSNEITVMPELIEVINPAGAVITTDAMGTQKQVAWAAREHHAHYLLALKDNHPSLLADVTWLFDHEDASGWQAGEHSYSRTFDRGHGREEVRECWVLAAPELLYERGSWRDLASVVRVRSKRSSGGRMSEQTRYFLTSLPVDAERALRAARFHWGIENGLHWVLDVAFDEDSSRARLKNAQATWVALRHVAVNLLKRDKTVKAGVEAKRLRAGWDREYLLRLLSS